MEKAIQKEYKDLDYNLALLPYFAGLVADADTIPERVQKLRFSALKQVQAQLASYKKHGYVERLLCAIAEKKGQMIMRSSTKTELEKILNPSVPRFDGNRFYPDEYHVPEEELIAWSETSLRGPLKDAGFRRYRDVFMQVFPEEGKVIFGEVISGESR